MGVKIHGGPMVCSTHSPEVVRLYSCAYETFRIEVSPFTWTREGKKYLIYCIV